MCETPILLLIFNRPALTREVFDTIRQQKPKFLFVAADGPREDREDDIEKCKAAREIINPDWDCELYTLYRDENLGCGRGPAEAISWFFNHVEQGIILEDDVIPSMSFFRYCSELLEIYRDEQRVFMISGINLLSPWKAEESSYTFAYLGGIPAWATWKRAWDKFDYLLKEWETLNSKVRIKRMLSHNGTYNHFAKYFDYFASVERGDVWDYQWLFSRWNHGGCSIVPSVNLIKNIGFGPDATHTVTDDHPQAGISAGELKFPLKHRPFEIDRNYDRLIFNSFINEPTVGILKNTIKVIKKLLN